MFDPSIYQFGGSGEDGPFGEQWDGGSSLAGLGHTVAVVGYRRNLFGLLTHLIVHDNAPGTPRNVAVPVGSP